MPRSPAKSHLPGQWRSETPDAGWVGIPTPIAGKGGWFRWWPIAAIAFTLASCRFTLAPPSPPVSPSPSPNNVSPQTSSNSNSEYRELERTVFQLVNEYRQSQNLPPLQLEEPISQSARQHSRSMATGEVSFSHAGFDRRIEAIAESISYRGAAENIAYNQGYNNPAQQAVEGWINSPGHRKNMLGNYDLTGVGIAKNAEGEYYYTQIFIKTR